eukprot:2568749-Amphidinium_carterae.1
MRRSAHPHRVLPLPLLRLLHGVNHRWMCLTVIAMQIISLVRMQLRREPPFAENGMCTLHIGKSSDSPEEIREIEHARFI